MRRGRRRIRFQEIRALPARLPSRVFFVTLRGRFMCCPNLVTALRPFQHIGILSLEFHVDKLSRPLL